ncbi:sensor histidine kinase, partial [Anaerotignum sp.]|uniref:sensor histidine kinase n=1 Tax=Anaerotignum sp. TaxID=2039241 RepID=UPI00399FA9D3
IYLLLWFGITSLTIGILSGGAYYGNLDVSRMMSVFFGFFILEAMLLALIMTMSTRLKKGGWWRNALAYYVVKFIWQVCKAILSTIGDAIHALPSTWKVAVGWLVVSSIYLTSTYAAGVVMILNFVLLIVFCSVAAQWQKLSRASKQLSAGNLEYKVDTKRMFRSFRQHGEDLNNISEGIAIALNQKMKSERLRTELITNVSHDIKTPLTSIINYVDLLKKEELTGQASAYVEVLDRQSRRLKKLTEDLVEASKASTGNIHCSLACTDIVELVQQAVGEYEEKLAASQLEAIISAPENEIVYGLVDGNLMWRVMSNLLSNACKYSQPNTRVYIQVKQNADQVFVTVKNISRDQLNIDPDELMERFVRGDSSRSTEGSGLGLNIARSLVDLQKGKFSLSIDGDLFKAQVRFARASLPEAQPQPAPEEITAEN